MEGDSCQLPLHNRVFKCISVNENECYLLVGKSKIAMYLKTVIRNIKNEIPLTDDFSDEDLRLLHRYLSLSNTNDKKKIIKEILDYFSDIDVNDCRVVRTSLNREDTIDEVLMKLLIFCKKNVSSKKLTPPYLYAWYKDKNGDTHPLGYSYEKDVIKMEPLTLNGNRTISDVDTRFLTDEGTRLNVPKVDKRLYLWESYHDVMNETIYICSLYDYLQSKDYQGKTLYDFFQDETSSDYDKSVLFYGNVSKYWPFLEIGDVINYESNQSKVNEEYDQKRSVIFSSQKQTDIIENATIQNEIQEPTLGCFENKIRMMRVTKQTEKKNTVYLPKLFRDFHLSETVPFMKLVLDNKDKALSKINKDVLIKEGDVFSDTKFVTKDVCKLWMDHLVLQTSTGYRYLHKENCIVMKVYDKDISKYVSLVIHFDGVIECVFNDFEIGEINEILRLFTLCNDVIEELNQSSMYSFEPFPVFDVDIFENPQSETKLEFMNTQLSFEKTQFESPTKEILPELYEKYSMCLQNFPYYVRLKLIGEVRSGGSQKIVCRYKRVQNYADKDTISSQIDLYTKLNYKQSDILSNIQKEFRLTKEESVQAYTEWRDNFNEELSSPPEYIMKKESGAEINLFQDENLVFQINEITSFSEYQRITRFIKAITYLYYETIREIKVHKFFIELDDSIQKAYKEEYRKLAEEEERQETVLDEIPVEEVVSDSGSELFSDSDSELFSDSDDVGLSDLEGGSGEKLYKVKSYYLNRLKQRDNELFKFKSLKKQPSGSAFGYAKYCQAVDERIPLVVSKAELDRINRSEEEGSGPKSYLNTVQVEGRSKDNYYICPKYWDLSKNLSLRPDYIDSLTEEQRNKMLIPPKTRGETKNYVLQRSGKYWKGFNTIQYYKTMITEESKLLHPEGYGLPCCFKISKEINRKKKLGVSDLEPTERKTNYISKREPAEKGFYAHVHPSLQELFGQSKETLQKRNSNGFLRFGVTQNKQEFHYPECPFIESYMYCISSKLSVQEFIVEQIIEPFQKDLRKFQRTDLHIPFRKIHPEDSDFVETLLNEEITQTMFQGFVIEEVREHWNNPNYEYSKNEMNYLLSLIGTLENYRDFLLSDENKTHEYLLPAFNVLFPYFNVVIFEKFVNEENNQENVLLKETERNDSLTKHIFIYKYRHYYEPIFFRDNREKERKEITIMEVTETNHPVINQVCVQIQQYIEKQRKPTLYEEYNIPVEDVDSYFINHYSQVMYLSLKSGYLLPIKPTKIPGDLEIELHYDFLDVSELKVNDRFLDNGNIVKLTRNHIKQNMYGKNTPLRKLQFLKDKQRYDGSESFYLVKPNIYKYKTKTLKQKFPFLKPSGLVMNQENMVVSLTFENGTYVPVIDDGKSTGDLKNLPVVGNLDMLSLENNLRKTQTMNECETFTKQFAYEEHIIRLAHYHYISLMDQGSYPIVIYLETRNNYQQDENVRFRILKPLDIQLQTFEAKEDIRHKHTILGKVEQVNDDSSLIVSIPLKHYIRYILKEPIMIPQDKKEYIQQVMKLYENDLFHTIQDDVFDQQFDYKNRDSYLCLNQRKVKYPCIQIGPHIKLQVKESSWETSQRKPLLDKILFLWIEALMVHGVDKLQEIVHESVHYEDLLQSFFENEHILKQTTNLQPYFEYKSQYIHSYKQETNETQIKTIRKLNVNPYLLQEYYGNNVTVTYDIENNSFRTMLKPLQTLVNESLTEENLREKLTNQINQKNEKQILSRYSKETKEPLRTIPQLMERINRPSYRFNLIDLELLVEAMDGQFGVILFSQKYNPKRKVMHYPINIQNAQTPILSFFHSYQNDEIVLSSIVVKGNYIQTLDTLRGYHSFWEKIKTEE
jgi:hypothetical protein